MHDVFISRVNDMIKEVNKKQKKDYQPITDKKQFTDLINRCVVLDTIGSSIELHQDIIAFIEGYMDIVKKRKFKDKHLMSILDAYVMLGFWEEENREEIDKYLAENQETIKYSQDVRTANMCISHYMELLISKTVDYIPVDGKFKSVIEHALDSFDSVRNRLYMLAEYEPTRTWVYVYTENRRYLPYTLAFLEPFNKMGSRVSAAMDLVDQNKIVKLCHERGYDVFAGWGYVKNSLKVNETITLEREIPSKRLPTKEEQKKVAKDMWNHLGMFITNPKFNLGNANHRDIYMATMASCMIPDREYRIEQTTELLNGLAAIMKNVPMAKQRMVDDRKRGIMWHTHQDALHLVERADMFSKQRWEHAAMLLGVRVYDYATAVLDVDTFEENMHKLHDHLSKALNVILYNITPYTEEELGLFITYFQNYITPRFKLLMDEGIHWVLKDALVFTMNIKDEVRVNEAYEIMKTHFTRRNSTELNEEFFDVNKYTFLFMSYNNKALLFKRLQDEPIDIVKYGKSQEIYELIYNILDKDVNHQDTTYRYQQVQFTEEGGVTING